MLAENRIKEFDYLYNIVYAVLGYPVQVMHEINTSGSRFSGKTYQIRTCLANVIKASYIAKIRVGIVATRQNNKDVRDSVWDEIIEGLEDGGFTNGVHFTTNISRGLIQFSNGSKILCRGLHVANTTKVSLKALKGFTGFEWLIDWQEEANEIDRKSRQALTFALRSARRRITITSCNPDVLYNDHITYLNDRVPFNEEILTNQHSQFEVLKENHRVKAFHYSNWRINNFLTEEEKMQLLELEVLDPIKARCWSLGMPGAVGGAVFVRFIDKMKADLTALNGDRLLAGGDYAQADSPNGHYTAFSLWLYNSKMRQAVKVGEWTHNNATEQYMSSFEQANAIIEWYLAQLKKYPWLYLSGLTVKVDYGAGGLAFIDILNNRRQYYEQGSLLEFVPVDKNIWKVSDRVEAFLILINTGQLKWYWDVCPTSLKQYNLISWKELKESSKIELIDLNDDTFDSDYYALTDVIREAVRFNDNQFIKNRF